MRINTNKGFNDGHGQEVFRGRHLKWSMKNKFSEKDNNARIKTISHTRRIKVIS
jgi:hypothetical protein